MATAAGVRVIEPCVVQPLIGKHRVVLEGGSIDVNGCGTLITTEECLLSATQQRNPPMDRAAYEQMFADYFGVQSVIWLDSGIAGDDLSLIHIYHGCTLRNRSQRCVLPMPKLRSWREF